MKAYRKRISLILASMMVLLLASCGVTSEDGTKASNTPKASITNETKAPEATASAEAQVSATVTPTEKPIANKATEAPKKETESKVESDLEVHFIDVGQGDSILLKSDGKTMLIDAGDNKYGKGVVSYLKSKGIKKIDYLVGTHPDADHIGGLDVVISNLDIGKIYMPKKQNNTKTFEDVLTAIAAKGLKVTAPKVGSSIDLGSAKVTIMGPTTTYDDNNNNSIVVKVTHGENSFLLTGDAELDAEEDMVASGEDLSATVLKVGHHGSHSSTSQSLLKKVDPTYAVISCGVNNKYGHPHTETMTYLKRANVKVYRTDEQQTIIMTSNGKDLSIKTGQESVKATGESSSSVSNKNTSKDTSKIDSSNTSKNEVKETAAPASGTYIGNKNTKKFHKSSCSSLPAEKNQVTFSSREKAVSAGYSACKRCNP